MIVKARKRFEKVMRGYQTQPSKINELYLKTCHISCGGEETE